MKTPTTLYSRLALATSVTLVMGYVLVYAWYTIPDVNTGDTLSKDLINHMLSNITELKTSVDGKISSQWNTSGSDINYTAGKVGIGTASPQTSIDVGGYMGVDVPNKITQVTPHLKIFSGEIGSLDNYPTCNLSPKIISLITLASGNYNSYVEIELYGSHRGYDNGSYFEYKKWILMVGDKVSSVLVSQGGSANYVNLWNGTTAGNYNNISASGFQVRLQQLPSCGSGFRYTYIVKYFGPFIPSSTRSW